MAKRKQSVMYNIVFDYGKPYDDEAKDDAELFSKLKEFYDTHKDSGFSFDVKVFDSKGIDITESQHITEMVADIMGDD